MGLEGNPLKMGRMSEITGKSYIANNIVADRIFHILKSKHYGGYFLIPCNYSSRGTSSYSVRIFGEDLMSFSKCLADFLNLSYAKGFNSSLNLSSIISFEDFSFVPKIGADQSFVDADPDFPSRPHASYVSSSFVPLSDDDKMFLLCFFEENYSATPRYQELFAEA